MLAKRRIASICHCGDPYQTESDPNTTRSSPRNFRSWPRMCAASVVISILPKGDCDGFLTPAAQQQAAPVALEAGWIVTEVGRQPWIVRGLMRTSEAVTGAGGIPVGYATLALVYLGVGIGVTWILRRLARAPLELPVATPDRPAGG